MSLMQQYADSYGIEIEEVKDWVNSYANGTVNDSVKEWMEPTKEDRVKSIKAYIQMMVDMSVTSNIKAELVRDRIERSESKVVAICPF